MKYTTSFALVMGLALAACSASDSQIGTAIVQTAAAQPSETPIPTVPPTQTEPPTPTNTPAPIPTNTPSASIDEIRAELLEITLGFIEGLSDVESVNLIRFNQGRLELELKTQWASSDRQPDVSFEVIRNLATGLIQGGLSREDLALIAEGEDFSIYLVTYSTDGDYRYQSETGYEVLIDLDNRSISYEEWVALADAGFK